MKSANYSLFVVGFIFFSLMLTVLLIFIVFRIVRVFHIRTLAVWASIMVMTTATMPMSVPHFGFAIENRETSNIQVSLKYN